jgi:hypothetical protein
MRPWHLVPESIRVELEADWPEDGEPLPSMRWLLAAADAIRALRVQQVKIVPKKPWGTRKHRHD